MTRSLLRDILLLVFLTVVMAVVMAASRAHGDGIRLRPQAAATSATVTLGDVADLDGAAAMQWSTLAVGSFTAGRDRVEVVLDDVRRLLDGRGVHWGRVTLSGPQRCTVFSKAAATSLMYGDGEAGQPQRPGEAAAPAATQADALPGAANTTQAVDLASPVTLRQLILNKLALLTNIAADQLRVTFSERDAAALELSVLADRFEIEPQSASGLGRVPVVVRRYRDVTVVETYRLQADVSYRTLALVAVRSISKGQTITDQDVAVREVTIDAPQGLVLSKMSAVVGQVAAAVIREGGLLRQDMVRSPTLIRRGQVVTVRALAGDLVIRMIARSLDDGSRGDRIRVRNERSREEFTVTVTGVQEAAINASVSGEDTP